MIANFQGVAGVLLGLQLASRQQRSVSVEKMVALEDGRKKKDREARKKTGNYKTASVDIVATKPNQNFKNLPGN